MASSLPLPARNRRSGCRAIQRASATDDRAFQDHGSSPEGQWPIGPPADGDADCIAHRATRLVQSGEAAAIASDRDLT
jgi:hypothetical protein